MDQSISSRRREAALLRANEELREHLAAARRETPRKASTGPGRARGWIRHHLPKLGRLMDGRGSPIAAAHVRSVLFALADAMNREGAVALSYADLAHRAGCARRTAMRVVLAAERAGWLTVLRRRVGRFLNLANVVRFTLQQSLPFAFVPFARRRKLYSSRGDRGSLRSGESVPEFVGSAAEAAAMWFRVVALNGRQPTEAEWRRLIQAKRMG